KTAETPTVKERSPRTTTASSSEPQKSGFWRATTVRAVVLIAVFGLGIAMLVPTVQLYMQKQNELNQLSTEAQAERDALAELEAEKARWSDPAYVVSQARERLMYVFPNESAYQVVDPETVETK